MLLAVIEEAKTCVPRFCDIQNNQGRGKGYQPKVEADNPYRDLDYSGCHKKPNIIIVLSYTEEK